MDSIHVQEQITDYVLDLLPTKEKQGVARHIAGCEACRRAVQQEREVGRLVRDTFNAVTKPDYDQLQSLMPPIPARRSSFPALLISRIGPYRQWVAHLQWAVACLLLVAMMGAFLFGSDGRYNSLASPVAGDQATLSSLNSGGTADVITTMEAGTLFTIAAQQSAQTDISAAALPKSSDNPPAAPLPVAPQVTPAPEATYFQ